MEQNNISNLFANLSGKQKLALTLVALVVISAVIVIIFMALSSSGQSDSDEEKAGSYVDDNGYTITTEETTNDEGETVLITTKEDEYGNVTTTDPDLITTYFPYQVMREHKNYDPTLRYYVNINEDTMTINAMVEECDVEADKALVREYIDSIPIDLSAYTLNYDIFSTDAICEN